MLEKKKKVKRTLLEGSFRKIMSVRINFLSAVSIFYHQIIKDIRLCLNGLDFCFCYQLKLDETLLSKLLEQTRNICWIN